MQITLSSAGKRFSREWIFRNLDYNFLQGEKYAVTGPNGSGKSTLLQVLSGSLLMNEGTCAWQMDSRVIEPENVHEYVSIAAPYLEVIEEMTASEFISFHGNFKEFIGGVTTATILQEANLAHAADKQIRFFSSGMKQRLKLAQAIFSDVPAVFLDEPCTNLDTSGFELYYKLIDTYCSNRLVIISSNDKNEYSFCDKELRISDFK